MKDTPINLAMDAFINTIEQEAQSFKNRVGAYPNALLVPKWMLPILNNHNSPGFRLAIISTPYCDVEVWPIDNLGEMLLIHTETLSDKPIMRKLVADIARARGAENPGEPS